MALRTARIVFGIQRPVGFSNKKKNVGNSSPLCTPPRSNFQPYRAKYHLQIETPHSPHDGIEQPPRRRSGRATTFQQDTS